MDAINLRRKIMNLGGQVQTKYLKSDPRRIARFAVRMRGVELSWCERNHEALFVNGRHLKDYEFREPLRIAEPRDVECFLLHGEINAAQ